MKRVFGEKVIQTDIIKVTEFQTLFKIHQMNQSLGGKKSIFKKVRSALSKMFNSMVNIENKLVQGYGIK